MPSSYYSGLCVGGPWAGKQITQNYDFFEVSTMEMPPLKVFPQHEHEKPLIVTTVYVYRAVYPEIGLWIVNEMTPKEMWKELLSVYIEAKTDDEKAP